MSRVIDFRSHHKQEPHSMEQVKSVLSTTTPLAAGADEGEVGNAKRTCLLILGMHRSGTSALTRTLSLLGAALPSTLLGEDGSGVASNPLGHWEPERVVALNDAALQAAGSKWRTPFGVDPSWYETGEARAFRERAVDLLAREYGAARLFVLKDPRTCLLAPLWLGALEDAGIAAAPVHVYRSPAEVAASLQKRNDIDPPLGELLWLRYVLDAERATRGLVRSHLRYDSLLVDWMGTAEHVADALGIAWPVAPTSAAQEIGAFIAPSARHHVDEQPSRAVGSVDDVYRLMKRWADEGESRDDWAALDAAREDLDRSVRILSGPIDAAFDLTAKAAKLRKIRAGLDTEAGALRTSKDALEARVGELEGALAQTEAARRTDEIALAEARTAGEMVEREWKSRLAGLEALIAVLRENADAATARAARLEGSQNEHQAALLESVKRAAQLAERLSVAQAQLGQSEVRAKELESALAGERTFSAERMQLKAEAFEAALARERMLREAVDAAAAARQQDVDALLRSDGRRSAVEEELGRTLKERSQARAALAELTAQLSDANDRAKASAEEVARMRARLAAAEAGRKAMTSERDALTRKLAEASKASAERASLAKKLASAAAAEKALRATVSELEAKVEAGTRLAKERQTAIEHLRRDRAAAVAKRDARIEALSASIHSLEAVQAAPRHKASLGKRIGQLFGAITGGRRREQDASVRKAVEESGLFDVAYYLRRYPDVAAEGVDPLDHYLRHGGLEGRGPSAAFNGKFYLEQNQDVRAAGMNPLVHYITYGRAEGRRAQPDAVALPKRHGLPKSGAPSPAPAVPAPVAPRQAAKRAVAASRPVEPAPPAVPPRLWRARAPRYAALADVIAPWCKTSDLPLAGALVVRSAVVAIAPPVQGTPHAALDWLAYLDGDATRPAAPAREAVRLRLCAGAVSIDDIWFENDTLLHFRISCAGRAPDNRHYGARVFQVDAQGGLDIVGEAVFATPGLQRVAAAVVSHFRPLLVVITDDAGVYQDATLLAFPSLCRRGAHFAELAAAHADSTPMDALGMYTAGILEQVDPATDHAVARVQIDLGSAIGTEPLLQPALAGWLQQLGVAVSGAGGDDAASPARAALSDQLRMAAGAPGPMRVTGGLLKVPADCIPSLSVLFARSGATADDDRVTAIGTGSLAAEPQYALSIPPRFAGASTPAGEQVVLPYLAGDGGAARGLGAQPLALRPSSMLASQDPRRLFPVPMDAQHPLLAPEAEPARMSVILDCHDAEEAGLLACVEGVLVQTGADVAEFVLIGSGRNDAASLIERNASAARVQVTAPAQDGPATPGMLIAAARSADSEHVLFLRQGVVLSDRRTAAVLASMLRQPDIFAAGCALASDLSGPRGRAVQRLVCGSMAMGEGQIGEVDLGHAVLPLLFPVAAPSPRLYLARRGAWIETAEKLQSTIDMDAFHRAVALEAIKAGACNLATTSLTAFDPLGAIDTQVVEADVPRDRTTALRLFRQ